MKKAAAMLIFALALVYAAAATAGREWLVLKSASVSCAQWSGDVLSPGQCTDAAAYARAVNVVNTPLGESLPAVDLAKLRLRLVSIPGVADARLRRRLPHSLHAVLVLRRPLARWAGGGLVDVAGHRYQGASDNWLPVFSGAPGDAARIAEFYGFAVSLLPPNDIGQVQLENNGEWKVFLRDGAILYLGGEAPRKRLGIYARYRADIAKEFGKVRAVDLRYGRGFAVAVDKENEA
ncbi:MAG: cell division protein FtsQ/DivIB [Gammaproteobacteria bacterium]